MQGHIEACVFKLSVSRSKLWIPAIRVEPFIKYLGATITRSPRFFHLPPPIGGTVRSKKLLSQDRGTGSDLRHRLERACYTGSPIVLSRRQAFGSRTWVALVVDAKTLPTSSLCDIVGFRSVVRD